MAEKLHIAYFGAHIGDAEITCGHVLAKYTRAGHKATIVHVTPGEKGHGILPPEQYEPQKRRETAESAKLWGCDVRIMPYKDGETVLNEESKLAVADMVRELKPDIVITHWKGSFHKDHINTHHMVVEGIFYAAVPGIKRPLPAHGIKQLYFADNWEDVLEFEPNVYVDITDTFDIWKEGIAKHALFRGEVSSFRYNEYYSGLSAVRGAIAGCDRAAAFMLPRFSTHRTYDFFPVEETMLIY
jgi:LmbE family N-acetylglucosaminyl deacetylase